MSKYVQVGLVAVALEDFKNLSVQDKFNILDRMFHDGQIEDDNHGQIVVYTNMTKDSDNNIVPFAVVPENDDNEPDPYEHEEEEMEVNSGELFSENDNLPPTLRDPSLASKTRAA